ncbi:hypothetical protein [Thalassospira permensis]|uniref:SnoaL-like domain-containing protein n=1 Tax=Thalassospira permensis NBRC 106175 TaxID=1353532 RepID=A0ABR4TLR1_9PROT|nr:hypothetical protein [Thalassospira permensis]KEO53726.1 hypothetical protein SMB34_06640 [Thalassospira permensis NBRC 106175]
MSSRNIQSPFPADDADRNQIWEMLVPRDIAAFVAADWSMVQDDFKADGFYAIDACKSDDPDDWKMMFPDLSAYRDEWLRQAIVAQEIDYAEDLFDGVFRATDLSKIDITGNRALVRKHFNGTIKKTDGSTDRLLWKTHYYCEKQIDGKWLITGFTGYLPNHDPA